jgi:pimeloyl-ACP methyl ester carboxylesterase
MDVPETRYAKSGNVHIAYCIRGDGPVDLVFIPGWVSNIELMWEDRWMRSWLDRLATFSRLIAFDKRGTGLSDRVPDDRLPDLETRMDDVRAVMDAAASQRAFLLGHSEGGLLAALFATTYPARTAGVVFFSSDVRGAWAPDHPWGTTREEFERELEAVERGWGNGAFARSMAADLAPSLAKDEEFLAWVVRYFRQSASPSAAIAIDRMWFETDARPIVRSLGVPSLVLWRREAAYAAESRYLAEHVPGTIAVELPGSDHVPWIGDDVDRAVDEIEAFLSAVKDEDAVLDRLLATVLFTDIVGSTERARELGDRAWGELLEAHHARVRAQLARFRGREIDTAGDGFLATFDGPARGVRCAQAIARTVRGLGLAVRAGVHTGELELADGNIRGIAVHVGARLCGLAGPDEVLVTSTVRDLVAGSGLVFQPRGEHELRGAGTWTLFAASD